MKLYTSDNTDLMEVDSLKVEGNNLIVIGTIMGAMPIEAVLTPQELRQSFKLVSVKAIFQLIKMLFSK